MIFILLISLTGIRAHSQSISMKGDVKDENNIPLAYATVVLLSPADSTMAYYGVSNDEGSFEIKNIREGTYLLQASLIGHLTLWRRLHVPVENKSDASIILTSAPVKLGEVVVSEEHVPMKFKKDTIEYNTAAFITKPNAVVEDLLKKLPGIDVDRAGNIKAMGEDVKKVLVDGREFFGSDQKLATRNVPADALKKVQIFDKKSDESEFTGIDDGTRDKTLNLLLKDDRKNAILGDLLAGTGSSGFFEGSGKVYKFTEKNQFAALGMINNINQSGFSFKDYIDFNGGMQSFTHGGGVQIKISDNGNSFPVNFGQPVTGLSTSGAAGLNFSRQFKKDSRIFVSYIANGSDRDLSEATTSRNFTDVESFLKTDSLKEKKSDRVHRFNFGLRDRIDSTQNLIINGDVALSSAKIKSDLSSASFKEESMQNKMESVRSDAASRFISNISGTYLKLLNRGKIVFKAASDASYSHDLGNSSWITDTYLSGMPGNLINRFQNDLTGLREFSVTSSLTIKMGKLLYIEPELTAGSQVETLNRTQKIPSGPGIVLDSLSPDFENRYNWFRPQILFLRNTDKVQLRMGIQSEISGTGNSMNNDKLKATYFFFTPNFSWEYEYKTGRRLRAYFQTRVNLPAVNQLLPVVNYSNPLTLTSGKRNLRPEVAYDLSVNWWIFDQFSFTSLLADITAVYTKDKINWDKKVNNDLVQFMSLINVENDYLLKGGLSFSTPVRSLGIKINADVEEGWNRGLSYISEIENVNNNFTHKFSLSIENRKKSKADIIAGGKVELTNTDFSIQKMLNNQYVNFSYFTDMSYNPSKRWNFQGNAEITNFSSQSFTKSITVPLLGVEVSYFFLKNNRGTLTLKGSDLLNRNTGIERTTETNYLREKRSNVPGRYFMLSFKFKLNKFGASTGGPDIKVKRL